MQKKLLVGLVLLLVSGLTFYRMIRPGFFPMHDDMQAMRLLQMHNCVLDGQIPCRWVPDMGFGYGYPQFNFYAPLPYYVMEFFNLLGLSILASVKLGFILSVLIGVVGMYLLASSLWGTCAGVISASLFALIPYRSTDMWVRGAMGELWGLAFFPFIFLAVRKAVYKTKNSEVLLALTVAALLTSHNISLVIFLPFVFVWTLYLLYQKYRATSLLFKPEKVEKLIIGFVWGFLISAFFIIPAWLERGLVQIESLTGGYFDYRLHFVSLKQLLASNYWNFGSSQPGRYDEIHLGVGLLQWTIPILSIFLFIYLKRKKTIRAVFVLVILGFIALFFVHARSAFLWKSFDILRFVQFPWRFLLVSSFLFSLVAGSVVAPIKKKTKKAKNIVTVLIVLVIFFNASYFKPSGWIEISDEQKFSGENWLKQQTISIYDYLPKTAQKAPDYPAPIEPIIVNGEGKFSNIEKGSNWYRVTVDALSDGFSMQLPIYYFPDWFVEVDGVGQDINYDNELGLISLDLQKGSYQINAKLNDTPVRKIANIISLFSILLVPYYLTRSKTKPKRI